MRRRLRSIVGGMIAAAAWYALALQLSVQLRTSTDPVGTLLHFIGSFTILTNMFVAVVLTAPTLPLSATKLLASPQIRSAAAAYIAIVAMLYSVVLHEPPAAGGAQAVTDFILHKLVPSLYLAYWLLFEPHGSIGWRAVWTWLEYPAAYLAYGVITGALTGWYLYPFLDVGTAGYARVLLGSTVLLASFAVMSAFVIAVDKALARWTKSREPRGDPD